MKKLGLQMKGSPYPMTASQENTFGPSGSNPNPSVFNGIKAADAKKSKSEGPEFIGALIAKGVGGAIAKTVAKKAVTKVGGSLVKKGLATMASLPTGSMDGLSAPTLAPKGKTGMGKALSTIGSSIKEGVRGLGEGISEKAGGSPKGFGDKVKNYIGSLDLITDSNSDGSIRKEGQEPIPATQVPQAPSGPGDVSTTGQPVGEDLKIKSLDKGPSTSADSVYNQGGEISIDKTANKNRLLDSLTKVPTEMGGPLNKIKNMCRG